MRILRKVDLLILTVIFLISLAACANRPSKDLFSIDILCESEDIYQIYYTIYFNGEYYGEGGMADYDGNELSPDSSLHLEFSKAYLDGKEDISGFSIDFSPYGKDDTSEIGTTNRVNIPAQYGQSYRITFSGDKSNGFTAVLSEN